MRIGTWNLQGRWDDRHLDRISELHCDVLLLTEVSERVDLPGFEVRRTDLTMVEGRRWAAVATRRPSRSLLDPHGASAMVEVEEGWSICASILPWKGSGARPPWTGADTAERTASAVAAIEAAAPTVWGGDWNHAMSGREWAGAKAGRQHILDAVERLSLQVPTAGAAHQIDGLLSIDHIAVPTGWNIRAVEHHPALAAGARLSDHDAYVVEIA